MKRILGIFIFILFITSNFCFPVLTGESEDVSRLIARTLKRSSSKEEVLRNIRNSSKAK